MRMRGNYRKDNEPLFIFRGRKPVKPYHLRPLWHTCSDLVKMDVSGEKIKLFGRWRSNTVIVIGGSRGRRRRTPPPTGSVSFVFAYVFAEKCTRQRSVPPPTGNPGSTTGCVVPVCLSSFKGLSASFFPGSGH